MAHMIRGINARSMHMQNVSANYLPYSLK